VTKNLSVYRDKEILRCAQNDILLYYTNQILLNSLNLMTLFSQYGFYIFITD